MCIPEVGIMGAPTSGREDKEQDCFPRVEKGKENVAPNESKSRAGGVVTLIGEETEWVSDFGDVPPPEEGLVTGAHGADSVAESTCTTLAAPGQETTSFPSFPQKLHVKEGEGETEEEENRCHHVVDGLDEGPSSSRVMLMRAMILLRKQDWLEAERVSRAVLCGAFLEQPARPGEGGFLRHGEDHGQDSTEKQPRTDEESPSNLESEEDFGEFSDLDVGTAARLTYVLATSLKEQGRFQEAEEMARHGLQIFSPREEELLGHHLVCDTTNAQLIEVLCLSLEAQGGHHRTEEAIQVAKEGVMLYSEAAPAAKAALYIRIASNLERTEAWVEAEEAALEGLEVVEAVDVATQASLWPIVASARWAQKRHRDALRARWAGWMAQMHHLVQTTLICDACLCRDGTAGETEKPGSPTHRR